MDSHNASLIATAAARTRGQQAVAMLKAVIDGTTYEGVAARYGVTRTAVERRIKAIAIRVNNEVGIAGMNADSVAFVRRLRLHRDAILAALETFDPAATAGARRATRILTADDISKGAQRIRARSSQPSRDVALFLLLFASGARPLEIARLDVGDYLNADGSVRHVSALRAESAITGRARPLYFSSRSLEAALDAYLRERRKGEDMPHAGATYRGLDPHSRLFLTALGEPFPIVRYGQAHQNRFLCRTILELYSKLFTRAELPHITPLSARRTVVARLCERGAEEDQIGELLGISDLSAVRDLCPRARRPLAELVDDLV